MVNFKLSDGSTVTLDAAITGRHTGKVTVTKYPVEDGMEPSDSATLEPAEYMVEGFFTNAPVSKVQQDERTGGQFVSKMTDLLWKVLGERKAITVEAPLRRYENMVMTSLTMPESADLGEAVQFSCEFRQVRFVNTQTVRLAPVQTAVPKKPTQKDKQGGKVPTPATAEQENQVRNSLAHDAVGHQD
jgi:hypothetical protein